MTTIHPQGDRILIRPTPQEEQTAGGIIIAAAKEFPTSGTVIATGPGPKTDDGGRLPLDVAVGDVVYFAKHTWTEIECDGEKLFLIAHKDILGVAA